MSKLTITVLLSLLALNFAQAAEVSPGDYEYTKVDSIKKDALFIKLSTGRVLEFNKKLVECDAYVDTCYLYFDNSRNLDYALYGLDVCYSENCKDQHPNFPNFQLVLKSIEERD